MIDFLTDFMHRSFHLLMDELAIEQRLSWDPASNMISGICYEHRQNAMGYLKLDSMDAIRAVHTKVASDECHVASEALVVMAQPYDNINHLPIPLIIIPSFKPVYAGSNTDKVLAADSWSVGSFC